MSWVDLNRLRARVRAEVERIAREEGIVEPDVDVAVFEVSARTRGRSYRHGVRVDVIDASARSRFDAVAEELGSSPPSARRKLQIVCDLCGADWTDGHQCASEFAVFDVK